MIVVRTPVRISFLGGGSDYPEHYLRYGGATFGVAIDRYSYVTVNRLTHPTTRSIRVGYSKTECVEDLDDIQHPSVRECLRYLGIAGGVEIHYMGDLPARSGLGSSSSFTVALLDALHTYLGHDADWQQLAEEAVIVERDRIKERVGVQDQYICAHGGLVHLTMERNGWIYTEEVDLTPKRQAELLSHMLLLDTGTRRLAHEILAEQLERTRSGAITADLCNLAAMVGDGIGALVDESEPIETFGSILNYAWTIKSRLSSVVSTHAIDSAYTTALMLGASGGKLLGAGGGGMLLIIAHPDLQATIVEALGMSQIPFGFDYIGSHILWRDR
jgi:D-glycero-alpha-D-manno-heptose-7-phosphate kinase